MTNFNTEKLTAVLENKEFVTSLQDLQTPEEIQQAFATQGMEFTVEDIKELGEAMAAQSETGELEEDALDQVAGGIVITSATIWAAAKVTFAVGAAGLSVYKFVKSCRG